MIKWCIDNKSLLAIISLFIIVVGAYVYVTMERQENPDVVSPGAMVMGVYPGGTPEDIERLIVKPLEDKISETPNIKLMESYALDNAGVIVVRLVDLPDDEINTTWDTLKEKVNETELPDNAWEPTVDTELVETYGMLFTVSGDNYSYEQLKMVADDLKKKIEKIDGIAAVEIDGHEPNEIHINLDLQRMKNLKVPMTQIGTVLKARNINIPGGSLKLEKSNVPISTTGEYKTMDDIKNTIVGMSESGNVIYMKDIADIVMEHPDRETYIDSNGEKALLLTLKYEEKRNVVVIGKEVKEIIGEFQKTLADDMNVRIITDQSEYVEDSISDFRNNLISAIVLVVIVILITMGFRSALVVSSAIPITVMTTFVFMGALGIVLHQVSIASLIVCLGLLVANAIVANDNMYLYLSKEGADRDEVIAQSINDVKIPILTSTLTTVASFAPLLLMKGVAGKFIKDLPVMVTIALMSSYLISLTVVPAMGHQFLESAHERQLRIYKRRQKKLLGKKHNITILQRVQQVFLRFYTNVLGLVMKLPRITILVSVAALLLSGLIVPSLGLQLFPFVDRDQYVIDITLKEGTTVEKTHEKVMEIEEILLAEEGIDTVLSKAGDGIPKFYTSFFGNQPGSNQAQFVVNGRVADISKIQNKLEAQVPGARIEVKQLENAIPVELPVQVRVSGEDVAVLQDMAIEIKDIMDTIEEGQHVQDNYGLRTLKMNVDVDQDKAMMVGLTNYDISGTVRMAINGIEMTKLKPVDSEDDIPVMLRVADDEKRNTNILSDIYVTSQITNKNVPVSQFAEISNEFATNKILRRNRERTITVGLHPKPGHTSAEVLDIVEEKMQDFKIPAGYHLEFGGESEERAETFESMIAPFVVAVGLIYVILMFQFSDLLQPLIIMGTIPLSFIGVIWGLKITGYPLGFMSIMGAISLMGIVVNNGIVLLDYINVLKKRGFETKDAVMEASTARLRPIMVGMVTTVIGLVPMGLRGGTLWAPLAYTIIFGLLVSSVLTMLVIPAGYLVTSNILDHIEDRRHKRKVEKAERFLAEEKAMKEELNSGKKKD